MITIIDSGGANIASIQFSLARLGVANQVSHDADIIQKSSHIILPGVGSAQHAMNQLKKYALVEVIRTLTQPVLGICLGMQLLFDFSAEGDTDCLGVIPGEVRKLSAKDSSLTIPHMGWNTLDRLAHDFIMPDMPTQAYAYFIHSYAVPVGHYTSAITCYGEIFSAAVRQNNFYGTQFHPERSGTTGSIILKNFLGL
jgi:imidazole glycerol-phosphate synthase subunit HisH